MKNFLQSVYDRAPFFVQNILLSSYGLYINYQRYGKDFRSCYDGMLQSQWLSLEELTRFQNQRLSCLISHAYENVPFYRDYMKREKLQPSDITTVYDLCKLPIVTREDVKKNMYHFLAENLSSKEIRRLKKGHTSGTTGSPLEFLWDRSVCVANNAVDWRQKNWAGIAIHDRCAVILGRTIVPIHNTKPPFWRVNTVHNTLWLSAFHMTDTNLGLYVDKLRQYNPSYIEGYPSTLYILAKYLQARGETMPMNAAFTSSETLHPVQRETIEESFETKVFDFYGLAERVIFATECDRHNGHHLNMDYGITEIVDEQGKPVEKGTMGWIVATGLYNYAMPLIRYKTNDVTALKSLTCSCGRNFPLMEDVTTKSEDVVTTSDGRYISSSVLTHPFKPLVNVIESQILQEDVENITVKLVKGPEYNDNDTQFLLKEMQNRLGPSMKIKIVFVDMIERSANGKFRWVVSKVPLNINNG